MPEREGGRKLPELREDVSFATRIREIWANFSLLACKVLEQLQEMDGECQMLLGATAAETGSRKLADPHSSAGALLNFPQIFFLGAEWADGPPKCDSARRMSAVMRRGFCAQSASQFANKLRLGLH